MDLTERVALVTGASSGIGAATAKALADAGAQVGLAARREKKLAAVADQIETDGGEAIVLPTDVRDDDQIEAMVQQTEDTFGNIDILVNNAGTVQFEPFAATDSAEIRKQVEVNLLGLMNVTHAVLPSMLAAGGGDVVAVSSVVAEYPQANESAYTAAKSGVNGFCDALREEVASDGVRVTTVMPGSVDTDMINVEGLDQKVLDPDDVAETIVFAVSRPDNVLMAEYIVAPSPPVPYR